MTTDRELLEWAAKAAGIEWASALPNPASIERFPSGALMSIKPWNPLVDDGDAFRLSLKLQIVLDFRGCSKSGPSHIRATYLSVPGRGSSALWVIVEYVPEEMFTPNCHKDEKFAAYLVEQGTHIRGFEAATRRAIVRAAASIGQQKGE